MNRACPKCRARRGRPCRTASGNPASKPHAARGAKANARSKRKPAKKKATRRRRNPGEWVSEVVPAGGGNIRHYLVQADGHRMIILPGRGGWEVYADGPLDSGGSGRASEDEMHSAHAWLESKLGPEPSKGPTWRISSLREIKKQLVGNPREKKPAKKKSSRRRKRNADELIVLAEFEGFELTPGIRKQWARFEEEVDRALQKHLNEEEYDEVLREAEHQYIPVYQTLSNQGRGVWDQWDHLSFDADKLNRKLLSDRRLVDLVDITGGGTLAEEIEMPDLDDLAEIAGRDSAVEGVRVIDREEPTIQLDLGDSFVHLFQYDDGTWWWQRRGFPLQTVEDEDVDGYPFAKALRKSLSESNPRKKKSKLKKRVKKAEGKVARGAKKAGRKVKKFAKTKTGYAAGGAGAGALLLGPLGAIAGAVGASSLHDNPGGDLGDIFEVQVEFFSDGKLKETFKEVSEGLSESKDPIRDFGTEGYPMYKRMLASLTKEMVSRGFLELNPRGKKKKAAKKKSRKKNPSAADHERAGRDALANSEEFHKRYERYGRVNDLLDTYQWLVIAHEELKYSDKSEPRIQARDGLEEIRRQLERIIK